MSGCPSCNHREDMQLQWVCERCGRREGADEVLIQLDTLRRVMAVAYMMRSELTTFVNQEARRQRMDIMPTPTPGSVRFDDLVAILQQTRRII